MQRQSPRTNLTDKVDDRPKARTEHLIWERVGEELVIYDQVSHVAHCLAPDAVAVWEHCDGRLTEAEIADRLTVDPAVVHRAVDALEERALLEERPAPGYSRRQAAVKVAKAAFVASLVYSVDVGTAAAAASHLAAGCAVRTCGSCNNTNCALCHNEGATDTNPACASGFCYCSISGINMLRCSIGRVCQGDLIPCSRDSDCCGNRCSGNFPSSCGPASPTC